ncbi:hypothetical protein NDU88_007468 [Pleurodeles waltl]|uniref:Uncharacterized protein n=1 Tax=Pleurodeles waltl TaxID=8319 RepID=A0AAV7VUJ8_PLEWA|nr:hypothetical protein NDU88_007468 [Pleurodeles waltl]
MQSAGLSTQLDGGKLERVQQDLRDGRAAARGELYPKEPQQTRNSCQALVPVGCPGYPTDMQCPELSASLEHRALVGVLAHLWKRMEKTNSCLQEYQPLPPSVHSVRLCLLSGAEACYSRSLFTEALPQAQEAAVVCVKLVRGE